MFSYYTCRAAVYFCSSYRGRSRQQWCTWGCIEGQPCGSHSGRVSCSPCSALPPLSCRLESKMLDCNIMIDDVTAHKFELTTVMLSLYSTLKDMKCLRRTYGHLYIITHNCRTTEKPVKFTSPCQDYLQQQHMKRPATVLKQAWSGLSKWWRFSPHLQEFGVNVWPLIPCNTFFLQWRLAWVHKFH